MLGHLPCPRKSSKGREKEKDHFCVTVGAQKWNL